MRIVDGKVLDDGVDEPWLCPNCGLTEEHCDCVAEEDPMAYSTRAIEWAHCNKEGWMSEYATNIKIEDEGAGEFLFLNQPFASTKLSNGGIAITPEEWPTLKEAIENALEEIKRHQS